MSAVWISILGLFVSALLTALLFPLYLQRRSDKRAAARELEDNADENLQTLSNRLAKERDRAEDIAKKAVEHTEEALAKQSKIHSEEMAKQAEAHQQQLAQVSQQLAECRGQLADCQNRISVLVGEMIELRKLIPPTARPPMFGPTTPGP